jgi:hypothetical protein
MKCATWGVIILLLAPASVAAAKQQSTQQEDPVAAAGRRATNGNFTSGLTGGQEDPVAAAARRVREQKKQQTKATKVWDNENIPKDPGALSVVGQSAPENEAAPSDSSASTGTKPAAAGNGGKVALTPAEQKSVIESDLAAAKEQLQTLQNDFDILQRKYTLDQQMYYGRTDFASDKAGAASLQDEQNQIDAKQQEMIAAQQKVADLQAKLNAAGTDTKSSSQ